MRIGIDFDNTLVCYDQVFQQVALEWGLIQPAAPVRKGQVRDLLRAAGKEDAWTRMQGLVYGVRLLDAPAFPGAIEFARKAVPHGVPLVIISHKTRHPYLGPRYDLHEAAFAWLERNGFFDPGEVGLAKDRVFLELTKDDKLARIGSLGCTHFLDDLPELLAEPSFPARTERFLFDPANEHSGVPGVRRVSSWDQFAKELFPA